MTPHDMKTTEGRPQLLLTPIQLEGTKNYALGRGHGRGMVVKVLSALALTHRIALTCPCIAHRRTRTHALRYYLIR